jgi:alpha-tubulin suppressor-like RCC1 family protein
MILLLASSTESIAATPMVALGDSHAVALRSDGKVLAWGDDGGGQLGTGRLPFSTRPGLVGQLDLVRSIGAGITHSLAVRTDGTVWAWGSNSAGQLGGGPSVNRASPAQVQGLANAAKVCGGGDFSLALLADGTVQAWGLGYYGALGNGSYESVSSPTQVTGLTGITAIACGNNHALAMRQDGTVWAWGSNDDGELGDGTTTTQLVPVQVKNLTGVTSVAAGEYFSAALKADGTVWEWGVRDGYASPHGTPRLVPVQTVGLKGIVALAASLNNFWLIAVQSDRQTWWNWQTGTEPVLKEPVGAIQSVAYAYGQFLFLQPDGKVLAGGGGGFGSLGDGTTNYRDAPEPVANLSGVIQVATGSWHGLALDAGGKVWSWGLDTSGQLGAGRALGRSIPGEVVGLSNIVQLDAGAAHNHAVDQDGNVWAWGDNGYGQFGSGSYLSSSEPVLLATISNVKSVAAGAWYSLALQRDGTLWQWGSMVDNQFDAPALPNRLLDGVIAIAAGPVHGVALKGDGTVWAWGRNDGYQLGDGTTVGQPRPRQVSGLSGVKLIAASRYSNYAVKADGTVVAWGSNARGQLGDVSLAEHVGPIVVPGLTDVAAISAGNSHVLLQKTDGSVWGWSWDYEASGELGNLGADAGSIAAPLVGLGDIQAIAAGNAVSAFIRSDGQVLMGGKNLIGQLGDGTFAVRSKLGLVVNTSADGFLNLGSGTAAKVAASLAVPFFISATGGITEQRASVTTTTQFNPADKGKPGAVFVTATVPNGALGTNAAKAQRASRTAATPPVAFTLVQLTPTGWQTVVNGQLLPYATGVMGDQLAAQTLLNNTATSDLKGAQFCVGYGSSAQDMVSNGNIRTVATIPGASSTTSCAVGGNLSVTLSVVPGWNLMGNPVNQSLAVSDQFGDASKVISVWKWDNAAGRWQFYAPGLEPSALQSFAASLGYAVLNDINAGDGFWVNAKAQADLGTLSGTAINLRQSSLASGWNLVSTASAITPQDFNLSLSIAPPRAGQVPVNLTSLWAWDTAQTGWYFYAPSLEGQGASVLGDYNSSQGYKDFAASGKTLGNGAGFWVKRP